MIKKILAASFWVSSGVLVGRLLGFVREAALASKFGVTSAADIAVLTLTIPNILVNIMVAGGLSAALIPEFKNQSIDKSGVLFVQSTLLVFITFSLLVLILNVFSGGVVYLFAPGMDAKNSQIAQQVLRYVMWLIPLTVMAGVSTAYLQSQNRFALPAMGTAIYNLIVVLGLLVFVTNENGLLVLVAFVIAGGALRWLSQIWVLRNSFLLRGNFREMLLSNQLLHRYWQGVTAIGVLTMYPVIYRSFASLQGEGELASVNFAYRLIELPLGVVITVLSVVLFPRLTELYETDDMKPYSIVLRQGLFWSVLLASSVAGVLSGAPEVFASIVYERGQVTSEDIGRIAILIKLLALSLPFQAVIFMSISGLYSKKDTKTPMIISALGLVCLFPLLYFAIKSSGTTGGSIAVVVCYALMSMLFIQRLYSNHLDLKYITSLMFVMISVMIINYAVMSYFATIPNRSDMMVVVAAIITFLIIPLLVSILFSEIRKFVFKYVVQR